MVLVLEDLHWADRSTRTFVDFLARSLRRERVVLVLSYRTDELHRRHPLRTLLSELDRLDRARRIELEPFDRDELAEALTDILGEPPSDKLVRAAVRAQRGQPAVHRGAAGGRARRPRRRPPEPAGRVHAADRAAVARRASGGARDRRRPRARRADDRRGERDRARCAAPGAARGRRRAGAGGLRGDPLELPSRAAARGDVRRPAAGRAERAAPRAGAGVRGPRGLRERSRRRAGVGDRPPLRDRRRPAGRAARHRRRPRSPRARCTPTATPPTSPSARSTCGRASPTRTR